MSYARWSPNARHCTIFCANDAKARSPAWPSPKYRFPRDLSASFRSEEHTSELQSLMRISYAVFCLKKTKQLDTNTLARKYTQPSKPEPTTNYKPYTDIKEGRKYDPPR